MIMVYAITRIDKIELNTIDALQYKKLIIILTCYNINIINDN
jgi:hypothetical protein